MSDKPVKVEKILVVDDESSLRLTFRYALQGKGTRVDECADGHEALRQLALEDYDLVILDQQMPDLKGTEVLRTIRERGLETPVIIVTAYGSLQVVEVARELNCTTLLHKPVTPRELRSAVAQVMDGSP